MIKLILVLAFCGISVAANSQTDQSPKTPNSEGIIRYLEYPVNVRNGAMNVSVPIYSLAVKGFELPISIDYHTGGIKVNQRASPVGLGWVLNTGGAIFRTIKDKPDDRYSVSGYGYLCDYTKKANFITYVQERCNYSNTVHHLTHHSNIDLEPDWYCFNSPGISGGFTFDKSGNIVLIPEQDLKVECDYRNYRFYKWKITDSNGTQYFYSNEDESYLDYMDYDEWGGGLPASTEREVTTWHIDKIVSNQLDTIQFFYRQESFVEELMKGEERAVSSAVGPSMSINISYTGRESVILNEHLKELYKIETNNEVVEFVHNRGREDFNPGVSIISSIIIKKKKGGQRIKEYSFATSYFLSTLGGIYSGTPSYLFKRLKLDAVEMIDSLGDLVGKYEFAYNKYNGNKRYPPRTSSAVDHWGYYNGKDANIGLLPSFVTLRNNYGAMQLVKGADRSADSESKKAFILDEVKYPTGGTVKIYYDSHYAAYSELIISGSSNYSYDNSEKPAGGLVVAKTVYDAGDNSNPIIKEYSYNHGYLPYGEPVYNLSFSQLLGSEGYEFPGAAGGRNQLLLFGGSSTLNIVYSTPQNNSHGRAFDRVSYRSIIENHPGSGSIEYKFANEPGAYIDSDDGSISGSFNDDFPRKAIVTLFNDEPSSIIYKDQKGKLLKRIDNTFTTYYRKIDQDVIAVSKTSGGGLTMFTPYSIYTGYSFLSESKTTVYGSDMLTETKVVDYKQFGLRPGSESPIILRDQAKPIHFKPSSVRLKDSFGEESVSEYTYIADYHAIGPTDIWQKMTNNFLLTKPMSVKKSILKNGEKYVTEAQYFEYNDFDGYINLAEKYELVTDQPLPDERFSFGKVSGKNFIVNKDIFKSQLQLTHNQFGHLVQQRLTNNFPVGYFWSFDFNSPTHILENVNLNQMASNSFEGLEEKDGWIYNVNERVCNSNAYDGKCFFGGSNLTSPALLNDFYTVSFRIKNKSSSSGSVQVNGLALNNIQSDWTYYEVDLPKSQTVSLKLSNVYFDQIYVYPTNANITKYQYTPVFGLNKVTDGNNISTIYEYDSFGRLSLIRDNDSNVVKGYKYRYVTGK